MNENEYGLIVAQEIISKDAILIISVDQMTNTNFRALKLKVKSA